VGDRIGSEPGVAEESFEDGQISRRTARLRQSSSSDLPSIGFHENRTLVQSKKERERKRAG